MKIVFFEVIITISLAYVLEFDEPHTLLVLAEEELVVIDLMTEGWPTIRLPYWCSMHSSAVTCALHITNVPDEFWQKIVDVGESQMTNYSSRVSQLFNLEI